MKTEPRNGSRPSNIAARHSGSSGNAEKGTGRKNSITEKGCNDQPVLVCSDKAARAEFETSSIAGNQTPALKANAMAALPSQTLQRRRESEVATNRTHRRPDIAHMSADPASIWLPNTPPSTMADRPCFAAVTRFAQRSTHGIHDAPAM